MHEDLVRLQEMDVHDRAAAAEQRAIDKRKQQAADATDAVQAATSALKAIEARIEEHRAAERTRHRDLEQARTYQARATKALETGMGDADAAQRQLERTTVQIDDLETEMLEGMERGDALDTERQEAVKALAAAKERVESLAVDHDAVIAQHRAVQARHLAALADVEATLPPELQTRYNDFRIKGRWAVAPIVEEACGACYTVVRQQHVSDLRRGIIKPCLNCHRFLTC